MATLTKKKKAKVIKAANKVFGSAKASKPDYASAFKVGAPIPKGVTMAPKGYKPKLTP